MKERRSKAMGDRGRVRGWLSIALLVNESGAVNALVPPPSAKTEDGAERNSEEEVRELRLATQVSHPMCELTAKGLRGPAQLGGDRASPRGEWASFPYVAGAGSRMGRPVAVP